MATGLPADWKWDESITDFKSLKANIDRYAERTGARPLATYAILGDIESAREVAPMGSLDRQREDGLCDEFFDRIGFWGKAYHPTMDLFKKIRGFVSQCVHLKTAPRRRLAFLDFLMRPGAAAQWIETMPWRHPWGVGNILMDTAYALAFEWKVCANPAARGALDDWFAWHDDHLDPTNGYWDPEHIGETRNLMAGAMHQYGIYFMFGREIKYPEAAVEATLSLQEPTGLFSPDTYSHNCLDIDAVFIIANLYNRYQVTEAAVRACLERAFEANLKCFHPDGGGMHRVGVDAAPDWWSTQCRVAILGWCARILSIDDFDGPWGFTPRHPFTTEDGGRGLPDWDSDDWYDAADWPRPAEGLGAG